MAAAALTDLVAAELARPVDPRVAEMAAAIAALHPGAARAVLFYGSCLRQRELDGLMLDFYLIVSDYRAAYGRSWLAAANRLIPPNVFPFEHEGLAAKYAVLSEADFRREMGPSARSPSVWARFAQPSRLVWAAGAAARGRIVDIVAGAAHKAGVTLLRIADLSRVWIDAKVYDSELPLIKAGMDATVNLPYLPDARYRAKVRALAASAMPEGAFEAALPGTLRSSTRSCRRSGSWTT